MLKVNDDKTEFMLVTSKRTKFLHDLPTSITINEAHMLYLFLLHLYTIRQHLVIAHLLSLLLFGTSLLLFGTSLQIMSGVPDC